MEIMERRAWRRKWRMEWRLMLVVVILDYRRLQLLLDCFKFMGQIDSLINGIGTRKDT